MEEAKQKLYLLSALGENGPATVKIIEGLLGGLGAQIEKTEDLGPRELAQPVKKRHQLSLVSVFFALDGAKLKQFEEQLREEETIVRFLLTSWRAPLEEPKTRSKTKKVTANV